MYLRSKASWRRMLTHRPPTSHMAVIEKWSLDKESSMLTQIMLKPDGNFLRLGHMDTAVNSGHFLMPGQDPLVFWFEPRFLKRYGRGFQGERTLATSTYSTDCDFIVFCESCHLFDTRLYVSNELGYWLKEFGKFRRVHGRFRKPIWKD